MLNAKMAAYARVLEEKAYLEQKTEKLSQFIKEVKRGEKSVDELDKTDLELLEEQLHYMNGYLRVLNQRIARTSS